MKPVQLNESSVRDATETPDHLKIDLQTISTKTKDLILFKKSVRKSVFKSTSYNFWSNEFLSMILESLFFFFETMILESLHEQKRRLSLIG